MAETATDMNDSWEDWTNVERAKRAHQLMEYYSGLMGEVYDEDEMDISCIIADFMHLCRERGFDFEARLKMAYLHYEAELDEEQATSV